MSNTPDSFEEALNKAMRDNGLLPDEGQGAQPNESVDALVGRLAPSDVEKEMRIRELARQVREAMGPGAYGKLGNDPPPAPGSTLDETA